MNFAGRLRAGKVAFMWQAITPSPQSAQMTGCLPLPIVRFYKINPIARIMSFADQFTARVKARPRTIIFPEGHDARILKAAARLVREALARVVVAGPEETVRQAAGKADADLEGITIRDPASDGEQARYCAALKQRVKDLDDHSAAKMLSDPLIFAGMACALGDVDAMVAGAATATGKVISAGLKTVGLAPETTRLSSFFVMSVPHFNHQGPREFIFADCAVNVDPDPEQLAQIAIASARSAKKLLDGPPRVALLSFSTKASARHARVDKVTAALKIARSLAPGLAIDGELQADAALIPAIARHKAATSSSVAGKANVLIFPDLDAANIGYKLVQYMAGAQAIGPFFQGFARPVCDLSRGATENDIYAAAIMTLALA